MGSLHCKCHLLLGAAVIAKGTDTERGQELGTFLHIRVCDLAPCASRHPTDPSFFGPWQVLGGCCAGHGEGGKAKVHLGRPQDAHSCVDSLRDKCPSIVQRAFLSTPPWAQLQPDALWSGPLGTWCPLERRLTWVPDGAEAGGVGRCDCSVWGGEFWSAFVAWWSLCGSPPC